MTPPASPLLDDLLVQAALRVEQDYFDLARIPSSSAVPSQAHLERVYTYELYHQMRTLMPVQSTVVTDLDARWRLHGEVDKSGSYIPGRLVPDFIWHVPGKERNGHVIEVKRASARGSALLADVVKLGHFLEAGYERATLVIVGVLSARRLANVLSAIGDSPRDSTRRVQILLHEKAGCVDWAGPSAR